MKNLKPLTVALSVLSLLMAPIALAQPGSWDRCCGDWGIGEHYPQMYDPTTVETIQGSVISVDTFTPMLGMRGGVHLSVETEAGVVSVHLGPSWYLDEQEMQITEGDNIEVTGSKVTFSGEPVIIAATVRNGDRVLTLRDEMVCRCGKDGTGNNHRIVRHRQNGNTFAIEFATLTVMIIPGL